MHPHSSPGTPCAWDLQEALKPKMRMLKVTRRHTAEYPVNTTCRQRQRLAVTARAAGPRSQSRTDPKLGKLQPWQERRLKQQKEEVSSAETAQPRETMGAAWSPHPDSRPARSFDQQQVGRYSQTTYISRDPLPSSPSSPFTTLKL